ncbi:MAG: aromatic-ring-hydroxylating dioxygenase subunit beta [Marinobacter sp.]|uniref:aromatic-ring-hydroxylating dioxygenase subunit beta n=1 Tax=Marinobacter sp. TaxID=50741 RepID=UPI003297FD43
MDKLTPELQLSLEQFYYREARLLDERRYQDWLALCTEDISYSMPARSNPLVDNKAQGQQDMISVQRELEDLDSEGCPLRDENYIHLMLRVERAFKRNSWAENPPARTRRIIGNVELQSVNGDRYSVLSNFHLFYSRPGSQDFFYAGQRRDELLRSEASYKIARREVVMDMADINVPTLGLLL